MKKIFTALAKYNANANMEMLDTIEYLDKSKIMNETKAFYPSIYAALTHIFFSDLNWLKRYRNAFDENRLLHEAGLVSMDDKKLKEEMESDYKKLFAYRKEADEIIEKFIEPLDEKTLASYIKYRNYKGDEIEKELWKTILHMFNHQTHHRGQVSILLDMQGIENDYSGLLTKN